MKIICRCCGRDINSLGQDNMSCNSSPICEDCYNGKFFNMGDEDEFYSEDSSFEFEVD